MLQCQSIKLGYFRYTEEEIQETSDCCKRVKMSLVYYVGNTRGAYVSVIFSKLLLNCNLAGVSHKNQKSWDLYYITWALSKSPVVFTQIGIWLISWLIYCTYMILFLSLLFLLVVSRLFFTVHLIFIKCWSSLTVSCYVSIFIHAI